MKGKIINTMLETIKQWLSGPSTEARQWVFMPGWGRKRKRRLELLTGPLTCVVPEKSKTPLPHRMTWQPLPDSTMPPSKLYATARQLVDTQTASILAYLPDFFKNTELNLDYEATYKMNRQQVLATIGMPFLARCFEGRYFDSRIEPLSTESTSQTKDLGSAQSAPPPMILDSPIAPALLGYGELAQYGMPEFSAIFSAPTPFNPQDFKKGRTPLQVPKFSKPTVLLVMSAPVHYELARPALENLENDYQIVIYFANPAKLSATLRQELSQRHFTIDANTLMPDDGLIQWACRYFNQRLQQIANLPVPATLKEALAAELDLVGDTVRIITLLETLLTHIRPVAVLGCMEKNRMSVAFKTLQARYDYKLLNFQHGIMPLTHNMDWLQFDRFFIWNPLTSHVIRQDGYPHPESLSVVGNPFWEKPAADGKALQSAKAQEILKWRDDSPLIGAYTQYAGDYLTHDSRRNYLKSLFAYLEARPAVKLLIKKHPLETDHLAEEMLAQTQLQDRVMLCAGRELDLWESFTLIQLSTTICSTTLLDSLRVNVPAVALDFTDIIANIGYGYDQAPGITIIREPQAVPTMLDALLANIANNPQPDSLQASTQSLVYPQLPDTYAQRVRQSLVELDLLSAP